MKKFLHRHHKSHSPPREGQEDGVAGDALKASLYEDTPSRSPPRIGSRPIKGNQEVPPATFDPAGSASPQSPANRAPRVDQQRDAPTNFSRLPPSRADAVRSQAVTPGGLAMPGTGNNGRRDYAPSNVPPSPAAIQPHDLASPEYSYLSNVYGAPAKNRSQSRPDQTAVAGEMPAPNRPGQAPAMPAYGPPAVPGTESSTPYAVPSGAPRQPLPPAQTGHPELSPMSPAVPRKDVSPGRTSVDRSGRDSLDHIPASVTNMPERKPVAHADVPTGGDGGYGPTIPSRTDRNDERHIDSMDETVERLKGIVNLRNTADTEVITKEAPAVVHETIVPTVHEIREERIEREIHTHDVIHRIQPVIDVEVLPPRHFVPTENGGLREVSIDDLPGREGHWGIVETVTRNPADFHPLVESLPAEPQVSKSAAPAGPDGYPRTETVIRHPPTLETGGRDTGQSWPIEIVPDVYAQRHGLPVATESRQDSGAAPARNVSAAPGALTRDDYLRGTTPGYSASTATGTQVLPVRNTGARDVDPRTETRRPANVEPAPPAVVVPDPRAQALRSTKLSMPGTFPSSNSVATIKTLQQQQHP